MGGTPVTVGCEKTGQSVFTYSDWLYPLPLILYSQEIRAPDDDAVVAVVTAVAGDYESLEHSPSQDCYWPGDGDC